MTTKRRERRALIAAGASMALGSLSGCASSGHSGGVIVQDGNSGARQGPDQAGGDTTQLPGYKKIHHASGDIRHPVFVSQHAEGPAVIIMHELTGLHRPTLEFADWLAVRGYRVYMPLLFGPLMSRQPVRNVLRICIRREIYLFSRGRNSPITNWLRSLARQASQECGGNGIGVVGMCLTGGFVMPLIADPAVVAGVAAQPSLPILAADRLGTDSQTLEELSRSGEDELLSLRFSGDAVSPRARHLRIAEVMCDTRQPVASKTAQGNNRFCDDYELLEVPGEGHSTLTGDYSRALARGVDTRARVLSLFERKLKAPWLLAMADS